MKLAIAMGGVAALLLPACTGQVGDDPSGGSNAKPPVMEFPIDYLNWKTFQLGVQRGGPATVDPKTGKPDPTNQIRDIYINSIGADPNLHDGDMFPPGTEFAMELWKVKMNGSEPALNPDNTMIKDTLFKIYIMGKELGWNVYTTPKPTGDWLYQAYTADRKMLTDPTSSCVDCHLKLQDMSTTLPASKGDWVYGYSNYFASKDNPTPTHLGTLP
jgi:hypothetical protein